MSPLRGIRHRRFLGGLSWAARDSVKTIVWIVGSGAAGVTAAIGAREVGAPAGMAGGHINGDAGLEGTMLGPCFFSGRVAGSWAAREAGFGEGFIDTPTRD